MPEPYLKGNKADYGEKPCDILHIVKLDDSRKSAFLIQDMFPITEEYIDFLCWCNNQTQGVTEKMKAEEPMDWVKRMNAIKNPVEEIVFEEIIYG